jgi:hypothetical protein
MPGGDIFGAFQIRYGTRNFQDPVMRTRGKAQPDDGIFQQFFAVGAGQDTLFALTQIEGENPPVATEA